MSMDYLLFLRRPEAFSREDFAKYCKAQGFLVMIDPEYVLQEDTGFVPFCYTDGRFTGTDGTHRFLTGFESYPEPYSPAAAQETPAPKGFFGKLFGKKTAAMKPTEQSVPDAKMLLTLVCHGDAFEVLMAHLFGAYLLRASGGVMEDPQLGKRYEDAGDVETEVQRILAEELEEEKTGKLVKHPFPEEETPSLYTSVERWLDEVLSGEFPEKAAALVFNLYEDEDGAWSMEMVGTERFDSEDEDWACEEVCDFGTREHPFCWKEESDWRGVLSEIRAVLTQYLEKGKYAQKLKARTGLGLGFADGDLEIVYHADTQ